MSLKNNTYFLKKPYKPEEFTMAKARKTVSAAMRDAEQRIAGMKAIDPTLDLKDGVSVAEGEALLAETRAALDEYNQILAQADEKLTIFTAKERNLTQKFNKKVLPAVGLKYGTDSAEYEMVGGTRDSERAKPKPKPTPTP
jgi:hypothetical protein